MLYIRFECIVYDIAIFKMVFITVLNFQDTSDVEDPMGKTKQQDNPFIEPSQQHTVVDMKGEIAN